MPRGDRTGPWGQGPMTGRGMGFCAGNATPGYAQPGGMGMAWRRGRLGGGGFRRAWGNLAPAAMPYWTPPPAYPQGPASGSELDVLKQQAEQMTGALQDINDRIRALEDESQESK